MSDQAAMTISNRTLEELLRDIEGWLPLPDASFLRMLARCSPADIVEIGCYRGRSTIALALGASEAEGGGHLVHSVDPHQHAAGVFGGNFGPDDREAYYRNMLGSGMATRAALINLPSEKVGQIWDRPVGLLFVDGDHHYDAVKRDIEVWSPHVVAGGVVAFDDASDKDGGPFTVICELLDSGRFETFEIVGKVHALKKL